MNTKLQAYHDFLSQKIDVVERTGFKVTADELHPSTFPHQRDAIIWAARLGRGLIAMSFGLGKTHIQTELARLIYQRTGDKFLIVCPLGVKHQFSEEDGPRLGVKFQYVRTDEEIKTANTPYLLTNYERIRDGDIDPHRHNIGGISLDEGSVLRSLGSKTYQVFNDAFSDVPYRYVCTATPSPNRYKELIHYADFLDIMDRGQALTRFFQRDPEKAGNLTLHPQHEEKFWLWVASWALFVYRPPDLGYDDTGYELPPLNVYWHRIDVDQTRAWQQTDNRGQHRLFLDAAGGVREASAEKRATMDDRISKMLEIVVQYFGTQIFNIEEKNENTERTQQGILRSQQGDFEAREIGVLPQNLQEQGRQRQTKEVYEGISENVQTEEDNPGEESRNKSKETGEIRDRPRIQGENKGASEGEEQTQSRNEEEWQIEGRIWDNPGRVQQDFGEPGGGMCYLRSETDGHKGEGEEGKITVRRPRSQNGSSPGSALSSLQLWNRTFPGQSSITLESSGVSDQFIIWCHLNDEQRAVKSILEKLGFSVSSIYGSLSIEEAERWLYEWKDYHTHVLLSKPEMLGSGLNLQQCSRAIFLGIDYRFQDFIQAIHRNHRYGQKHPVDVHIIYAESEDQVVETLKRKWTQHDILVAKMQEIIKRYGLVHEALKMDLKRNIGLERQEVKGSRFTAVNNDCVVEILNLPDNHFDLLHTSIPFGNHYSYTISYEDFGHNPSDNEFWRQMDYLIPELLRILKPGRVAAIHVKDRILYGHQTPSGFMEVSPFSDECVFAFKKHGWLYEGRRTIVTDVVRENNSTYRLGWTEMTKDATKMGSGLPEYLLLFRKPPTTNDNAYADERVTKSKVDYTRARWQIDAHSFWRSNGNRHLHPDERYDHEAHVARLQEKEEAGNLPATFFYEPPVSPTDWVWDDIVHMRTLNSNQSQRQQQNHICPLSFDVVERVIRLYSNNGDLILDPFAGLFTVVVKAVEMGRRGYGVELSLRYFEEGLRYCQEAEIKATSPTLFDLLEYDDNGSDVKEFTLIDNLHVQSKE